MYYISRKVSESEYCITDSKDGVEELYNLEQVQNFIKMGFKINGVDGDLVYVSSNAPFACYVGDMLSKSDVSSALMDDYNLCGTVLHTFNRKECKLDTVQRVKAFLDENGSVSEVRDSDLKSVLCSKARVVRSYGYCVKGSSETHSGYEPLILAAYRKYRRDGIYYKVLGLITDDINVLNARRDRFVLLDNIVANAHLFQNVVVYGDMVSIRGLDAEVTYNMDIVRKVYKHTLSDVTKKDIAKSKLMNKTEVVVLENGRLQSVKCKETRLVLPDTVSTVPEHSISFEADGELSIVFPDSVRSIRKDFLSTISSKSSYRFEIGKMPVSCVKMLLPMNMSCAGRVYIHCSDASTMGYLILSLVQDCIVRPTLHDYDDMLLQFSKYTNISDFLDFDSASKIMRYTIDKLDVPSKLPELMVLNKTLLNELVRNPSQFAMKDTLQNCSPYTDLCRIFSIFGALPKTGDWLKITKYMLGIRAKVRGMYASIADDMKKSPEKYLSALKEDNHVTVHFSKQDLL